MNPSWRKNYVRYRSFFLNVMASYKRRADLKVYLEIFLSLATISMFAIFALRPTLLTIAELIREIEVKKETLAVMEEKIQNLNKAQALYDREREKVKLIESAIPLAPSPEDFARQIEGLTQKHQVEIVSVTIGRILILGQEASLDESQEKKEKSIESFPEGARELNFTIKTSTSTDKHIALINLLSDLENLRSPVKIDSLDLMSESEKGEETKKLVLVVNGRLPYFKEVSNVSSTSQSEK